MYTMRKPLKMNVGKAALAYLDELEDQNAHGERLREIAGLCEQSAKEAGAGIAETIFAGLGVDFGKVNDAHIRAGELTEELYELRYYLTRHLRDYVYYFYGDDALKVLNP